MFQGADGKPADRDTLLARMRDHIRTVVGRYKGKIHGWDVVNEAIDEDGSMRKSPWQVGIGDDYVAKAFEFAHEADPDAELYYNDFNLEKPAKRAGVIKLVKDLQARKLRIDGIGNQAHWRLDTPAIDEIDDSARRVARDRTEGDVQRARHQPAAEYATRRRSRGRQSVRERSAGRRAAAARDALRRRVPCLPEASDAVTRVTFWGLSDADSWLNRGRMNFPLLWDRQRQPKPAFNAVVDMLRSAK